METRFKETISRSEGEAIAKELETLSHAMKEEDSGRSNDWAWSLDRLVCSLRGLFEEEKILSDIEKEYDAELNAAWDEYQKIEKVAKEKRETHNRPYDEEWFATMEKARIKVNERIAVAEKKAQKKRDVSVNSKLLETKRKREEMRHG